jgi:glycosyltransferase involved in cell wall biosynthesis
VTEQVRVTAMMPVRNTDPQYLHEAIKSILDQTVPNWRLLLVAEPADLADYAEEIAGYEDDRLSVVANEGRRLAGAINTGMRHARSEFVALLLADDRWAPHAAEVLGEHLDRHPEADFFHSGRQIVDDQGEPVSSYYPPKSTVRVEAFIDGGQAKHLLCWRRSMGLDIGGLDERFLSVGTDDYDFPWTMAERGARFEAVDACLYLYRDHRQGERLTTHMPRSVHVRELRRVLRKHGAPRSDRRQRVQAASASYLGQCLYRNRPERWLRTVLRRPPQRVWRDEYR